MYQKPISSLFAMLVVGALSTCPVATGAREDGDASCILGDVSDLRWQKRVVFVLASPDPERDIGVLRKHASSIGERDVVWFALHGDAVTTNSACSVGDAFIRSVFAGYGSGPQVILIGKDGGVKMRTDNLRPDAIFDEIDSMPMRRREMLEVESGQ